jgi:hypothetical protein
MAGHDDMVWWKSTRSSSGACIEIATNPDGETVHMRDSKDPSGPVLEFDRKAFEEFIAFLKVSEKR